MQMDDSFHVYRSTGQLVHVNYLRQFSNIIALHYTLMILTSYIKHLSPKIIEPHERSRASEKKIKFAKFTSDKGTTSTDLTTKHKLVCI